MAKVTYNERSWAIDIISEINLHLANKSWHFKGAGGESTISSEKSSLFPDVLIFKDQAKNIILQGWELKMPDTPINDSELISNAIKKANILQRNSFILWNVKSAVLYFKQGESFSILRTWNDIDINNRTEVKPKEALWKSLLHSILTDLNDYFETGEISDEVSAEILAVDAIIDVILENIPSTAENLRTNFRRNSRLEAQINNWWLSSATEYGYNPTATKDASNKLPTLSKVILTDWVFKIIFANVLKRHFNEARAIESINNATSIEQAKEIIASISEHCNFWNIFSDNLAIEFISNSAWKQIIQLNQFLSSINIEGIEIEILHNLLQSSIVSAKRKVAGQFATPKKLADLLVRLTVEDKEGVVIDTCCGTGTIINQAYLLKEEYEFNQDEIINSIWASDKHSFPIQLSTLTLAKPNNIGKVLNIFRADVIDLEVGENITFKDPNNGNDIIKQLPSIDYVVSNLPFIKSKEIQVLNPNITEINNFIYEQAETATTLSGKSDIFAYIPFYLHKLLSENGKIGLILSNAWLGTDYGEIFLELIQNFYDIETVVISGKGKWFDNADVVTTFLIAKKRNPNTPIDQDRTISFCTLKENINEIPDTKQLSENILLETDNEFVDIQNYSVNDIANFETIGVPWCGYFANLNWLVEVSEKLIDCNQFFNFTRGERRGWNALFYPASGHGIEAEYIKPVLKNLRGTTGLYCSAEAEAFCCSRSIEELEQLNHSGALQWIRSFENQNNKEGIPLTTSLRRANHYWYEMKSDNMADYVANVNYDRSLFIAECTPRVFIDQRMIGLSLKEAYQDENRTLLLALLNSVLSMFFIESFGFGRGLGALDLRATKFERDFKLLNFQLLSDEQKQSIINAFQPIANRNRLPLRQEIEQTDRVNFERVLLEAFGIDEQFEAIKSTLLHLYKIRFAVKEI
ncbi:N-6 DNA methylase [Roseivirga sp. UBA838]|uniref:N-6 DNA methylase n=1 Tax=Roseivirga sp. UBA838 TaxID=1947393 RepID=UPI002579A82B|nr:N-6 DNA methylase [Roseivirga sp. UBA838]|tara:strand:- start:76659 stop:79424 length:2766 start_codon:yes stop_codon:yes gene_type:complete